MKKVGITGGIGCGKSTVVAEFVRRGVYAFVADDVAAAYYADTAFLAEVRRLFGNEVFRQDGSADKRRIANVVFADSHKLAALNALVHPRVMADFDAFCRQHSAEPYVLFESAILYDYGFDALKKRDGVDERQLMARVANQMPAEEMMRRADYVILNYEGNPRQRQVALIDKMIRQ